MESFRTRWSDFLWRKKTETLATFDEAFFQRSAMIFSPHQDDETLGCGGLIAKKRCVGAQVKIVMMTDGSRSHSQFMAADELVQTRTAESIAAAETLGVDRQDVIHLGCPDGFLSDCSKDVIEKIVALFFDEQPEQIFIPYSGDRQTDHQATRNIVRGAFRANRFQMEIYEYPVWFWNHWPWFRMPQKVGRYTFKFAMTSLAFGFGFRFLRDFQYGVPLSDVIEAKRAALAKYKSQMTKLNSDVHWPTLPEISNGDFLACFFQEFEIYHRCGVK